MAPNFATAPTVFFFGVTSKVLPSWHVEPVRHQQVSRSALQDESTHMAGSAGARIWPWNAERGDLGAHKGA